MSFKILVLCAVVAFVNAGYLEPALRYAAPAPIYHQAPAINYVSPAITKTDFIPGSYSSSYRSDVITPRVKYTETPAVSYSVPQPPITVQPLVARVAHVAPVAPIAHALPAIAPAPIARVGFGYGLGGGYGYSGFGGHGFAGHGFAAPLAHGFAGHGAFGYGAPLARGW